MTYKQVILRVQKYINIDGDEARDRIKDFINDAILDFARIYDWKFLQKTETITANGSNSYDLTSVLTEEFLREIDLFLPTSTEKYIKMDYNKYAKASDKTYFWAIVGTTLYLSASSGDFSFMYTSLGSEYPLVTETTETDVIKYYYDIISKMTVIKFLNYLQDVDTVAIEKPLLTEKLLALKGSENRARHRGQMQEIRRGGLGTIAI